MASPSCSAQQWPQFLWISGTGAPRAAPFRCRGKAEALPGEGRSPSRGADMGLRTVCLRGAKSGRLRSALQHVPLGSITGGSPLTAAQQVVWGEAGTSSLGTQTRAHSRTATPRVLPCIPGAPKLTAALTWHTATGASLGRGAADSWQQAMRAQTHGAAASSDAQGGSCARQWRAGGVQGGGGPTAELAQGSTDELAQGSVDELAQGSVDELAQGSTDELAQGSTEALARAASSVEEGGGRAGEAGGRVAEGAGWAAEGRRGAGGGTRGEDVTQSGMGASNAGVEEEGREEEDLQSGSRERGGAEGESATGTGHTKKGKTVKGKKGEARSQVPLGHGGRSIDEFYARMGLPPFQEIPGKPFTVRVRQHTNPLKASLAGPTVAPDWGSVFEDPSLPLFLDVGCASARLSLLMALRRQPGASLAGGAGPHNVLGLEIRTPLVERANAWAQQLGLRNAHFLVTNATLSLADLLRDYPGELSFVAVLCPDPQFKKKHRKRRIVQRPLVEAVAARLAPGGIVFLQSDILEVALDMRRQFLTHAPGLFREWSSPGAGPHPAGGTTSLLPQPAGETTSPLAHPAGGTPPMLLQPEVRGESLPPEPQNQEDAPIPGLRPSPSSGGSERGNADEEGSGKGVRAREEGGCESASERGEGVEERSDEDGGEGGEEEEEEEVVEWVAENPLGAPSEREAVVLSKCLPVYRTIFIRR